MTQAEVDNLLAGYRHKYPTIVWEHILINSSHNIYDHGIFMGACLVNVLGPWEVIIGKGKMGGYRTVVSDLSEKALKNTKVGHSLLIHLSFQYDILTD